MNKKISSWMFFIVFIFYSSASFSMPTPIIYWSFDNCDASNAINNGLNGYLRGNVECVQGIKGKALHLATVDDYISLPDEFDLTDFTISFWVKLDGKPGDYNMFFQGGNREDEYCNELNLAIRNEDNALELCWKEECYWADRGVNLCDNKFHHIVYVKQGEIARVFVDGELFYTFSDANLTGTAHIENLVIGEDQDYLGGGFEDDQILKGTIDELKVYNVALSDDEILSLYQEPTQTSQEGTQTSGEEQQNQAQVELQLSPQKDSYATGETLNLSFSCTPNGYEGDTGDFYVLAVGPGNTFYSITQHGVFERILPYYSNWQIEPVEHRTIFSFPYMDIFRSMHFSLMSGIVKNGQIISNIATLQIPSSPPPQEQENNETIEENTNNTSENNQTEEGNTNETTENEGSENATLQQYIWNPLKTIAYEKYITPILLKAGKDYIHALGYKHYDGLYYMRLNKKGNVIIPPYKLEGVSGNSGDYRPAMVVDENDNAYIISTDNSKNFYLTNIDSSGEVKDSVNIYKWENTYGRPSYLKAFLKDNKIYLTGEAGTVTITDRNNPEKQTVYYSSIFLMVLDTDGNVILSPQVFSGKVCNYDYSQSSSPTCTDEIYARDPAVVVDNDENIHIFYQEKDDDLHTGSFLKYIRLNLSSPDNSYMIPIKKIDTNYIRHIDAFFDKNTNSILVTFIDSTHTPSRVSVLKVQGNTMYGPVYIPTNSEYTSHPHVFVDKFNNVDVYYDGDNHNVFHVVVSLMDLNNVVHPEEKIVDNSVSDILFAKDIDGNLHFMARSLSTAKFLYYSNTNPDNTDFSNLPDIVLSPSSFSCTPSNNVDIGDSINCSFEVYNISDQNVDNINLKVKIEDQEIFSTAISLDAWSDREISFIYSPQDINTPEYPPVEISAEVNINELTLANNKISPSIHVRQVPDSVNFMVKVYDETYDPDHEYIMPMIRDVECTLYNRNTGQQVAEYSSYRFLNVPVGESESSPAEYKIVCSKEGYNDAELNVDIWRDAEDPYKADFSVHTPIKMYMNTWGTLFVDSSYEDENGNIRALSGVNLHVKSVDGLVDRNIQSCSSGCTIDKLPAGNYTITLEKQDYEPRVISGVSIYPSQTTQQEIVTQQTTIGTVLISLTTTAGYIPDSAQVVFKQGDNVVKSATISNGEYEGSIEKGTYNIEISASGFDSDTVESISIRAGVDNHIDVTLNPSTPSNLEGYTRGEEVAILPYVKIEELPSSPLTDGYKVEWYTGQFKIKTDFIGEEQDNRIYSLNQVKIKLKGLPLYKAVVSSTWDPTSILDLPENIEAIYNAYSAIPMAVTPDIPIGAAVATYDNTKVVVDKIKIYDDQNNVLYDQGADLESDGTFLIDVNQEVDSNSNYIYMEIYMRIGKNDISEGFTNDDLLYGLGVDHMKITYKVPRKKPEYGWYFYNPITGNTTHLGTSLNPGTNFSLGIFKWKPFKPYSIDMQYLDTTTYNAETGL